MRQGHSEVNSAKAKTGFQTGKQKKVQFIKMEVCWKCDFFFWGMMEKTLKEGSRVMTQVQDFQLHNECISKSKTTTSVCHQYEYI